MTHMNSNAYFCHVRATEIFYINTLASVGYLILYMFNNHIS